jgi:hypothetical protein
VHAEEPTADTDWRNDKLANQFKLWNQPEMVSKRSELLTQALLNAGLIKKAGGSLLTTGARAELVKRLVHVLTLESTIATQDAAIARAAEDATALPARARRAPARAADEGYGS